MKLLITLLFACVLFSCNVAKDNRAFNRVLTRPVLQEKVFRELLKRSPCVNDSTTIYLPGEIVETEHTDTLYSDYSTVDTFLQTEPAKIKVITRTVTRSVHDTLKVVVKDIQENKLCLSDLAKVQSELSATKIKVEKGKKWFWISLSLILIILFCVYLQFKKP